MTGYLDFAYQHRGKSKADHDAHQQTTTCLEKAFALREKRDTPNDQIQSSLALATTHHRLALNAERA